MVSRVTPAGERSRAWASLQVTSRSCRWQLGTRVDTGLRGAQSAGGTGETPGCSPSLHCQGCLWPRGCDSGPSQHFPVFIFRPWDGTTGPPHLPSPGSSSLSGAGRHQPLSPLTRPRSSPLSAEPSLPVHTCPPHPEGPTSLSGRPRESHHQRHHSGSQPGPRDIRAGVWHSNGTTGGSVHREAGTWRAHNDGMPSSSVSTTMGRPAVPSSSEASGHGAH